MLQLGWVEVLDAVEEFVLLLLRFDGCERNKRINIRRKKDLELYILFDEAWSFMELFASESKRLSFQTRF